MLTGISTKQEVLDFFIKWYDREFTVLDDDDSLVRDLMIASADDLIAEDVDYWSNESVKKLYQVAKSKLLGE
jgi:CTP:phosphocholine cytidylyltransferase-like protein